MFQAMKREALIDELEAMIDPRTPLSPVVATLRKYRGLGISRDEVVDALEAMRGRTTDEAIEDRILEVLDIATGFCSREQDVWGD